MIQTKTIAMLMIAIATVGTIGTAGLLVQHANAASTHSTDVCNGFGCIFAPTHSSSVESLQPSKQPSGVQEHNRILGSGGNTSGGFG